MMNENDETQKLLDEAQEQLDEDRDLIDKKIIEEFFLKNGSMTLRALVDELLEEDAARTSIFNEAFIQFHIEQDEIERKWVLGLYRDEEETN